MGVRRWRERTVNNKKNYHPCTRCAAETRENGVQWSILTIALAVDDLQASMLSMKMRMEKNNSCLNNAFKCLKTQSDLVNYVQQKLLKVKDSLKQKNEEHIQEISEPVCGRTCVPFSTKMGHFAKYCPQQSNCKRRRKRACARNFSAGSCSIPTSALSAPSAHTGSFGPVTRIRCRCCAGCSRVNEMMQAAFGHKSELERDSGPPLDVSPHPSRQAQEVSPLGLCTAGPPSFCFTRVPQQLRQTNRRCTPDSSNTYSDPPPFCFSRVPQQERQTNRPCTPDSSNTYSEDVDPILSELSKLHSQYCTCGSQNPVPPLEQPPDASQQKQELEHKSEPERVLEPLLESTPDTSEQKLELEPKSDLESESAPLELSPDSYIQNPEPELESELIPQSEPTVEVSPDSSRPTLEVKQEYTQQCERKPHHFNAPLSSQPRLKPNRESERQSVPRPKLPPDSYQQRQVAHISTHKIKSEPPTRLAPNSSKQKAPDSSRKIRVVEHKLEPARKPKTEPECKCGYKCVCKCKCKSEPVTETKKIVEPKPFCCPSMPYRKPKPPSVKQFNSCPMVVYRGMNCAFSTYDNPRLRFPTSVAPSCIPHRGRKTASRERDMSPTRCTVPRIAPVASTDALFPFPCCDSHFAEMYSTLNRLLLSTAHDGNPKIVGDLLDAGANINFTYSFKWTALHKAAAKGHAQVISLLLERGANVNARTSYGFTPLHVAAYNDPSGQGVKELLDWGADVDAWNRGGKTALHLAAERGNVEAVNALLHAGARKMAKDDGGQTAFNLAKINSVRKLLRP